jgi:hypothetical protein
MKELRDLALIVVAQQGKQAFQFVTDTYFPFDSHTRPLNRAGANWTFT